MTNEEIQEMMGNLRTAYEGNKPNQIAAKQANAQIAIARLLQHLIGSQEDHIAMKELRAIANDTNASKDDQFELWFEKWIYKLPSGETFDDSFRRNHDVT